MQSHVYEFPALHLVLRIALISCPMALFAAAMHLGALTGWLPPPFPTLDTDRTVLFHQAEASRQSGDANLVLIGDSSCLMDISAPGLDRTLPGAKTLNLGTLSYLDLRSFGAILRRRLAANPGRIRTIVLMMHPEALRRPSGTEYHRAALDSFYAQKDFCSPTLPRVLCAAGVETFRGRILSRILPRPLSGAFASRYGFTWGLWAYLSAHQGSAIDPNQFDPTSVQRRTEFNLTRPLERASREFSDAIPPGTRLVVGITPLPESVAPRDFGTQQRRMLRTWAEWLEADAALTELPAVWPDSLFASETHLNAAGRKLYTDELGRALARAGLAGGE